MYTPLGQCFLMRALLVLSVFLAGCGESPTAPSPVPSFYTPQPTHTTTVTKIDPEGSIYPCTVLSYLGVIACRLE